MDPDPPARLVLDPGQRELLVEQCGLDVEALGFDADRLAQAARDAEALRRGEALPGVNHPVLLVLSAAQRDALRDALGVDAAEVVVDPDRLPPSFGEPWRGAAVLGLTDRVSISHAGAATDEATLVVRLVDSGGAGGEGVFGTGSHPTTRLVAELMTPLLRPGCTVLDVGTGSGVLAIAAALLGAGQVRAIDVDPHAVLAASANAAASGVADRVRVDWGEVADVEGGYDLVLANVVPSVLLAAAGDLRARLGAGGRLLMSGIVAEREGDMVRGLAEHGLELVQVRRLDRWCGLDLRAAG